MILNATFTTNATLLIRNTRLVMQKKKNFDTYVKIPDQVKAIFDPIFNGFA